MFIASSALEPPARFGKAEHNLTSIYLVSFRLSEPRMILLKFRSIDISLLRSEEPHSTEALTYRCQMSNLKRQMNRDLMDLSNGQLN